MDQQRWRALMKSLGFNANDIAFNRLQNAYAEPHRHYHNQSHIADSLAILDQHLADAENKQALELAIWFHDAIYNTRSNSNEQDSANWATQFLSQNNATTELINTTHELIMCTVPQATPSSALQQQMKDIDLAILGAEQQRYQQFEVDIRREYRWVPNFVFRRKRREILRGFLQGDGVFHTTPFQHAYEDQARQNLTLAIKQLGGS